MKNCKISSGQGSETLFYARWIFLIGVSLRRDVLQMRHTPAHTPAIDMRPYRSSPRDNLTTNHWNLTSIRHSACDGLSTSHRSTRRFARAVIVTRLSVSISVLRTPVAADRNPHPLRATSAYVDDTLRHSYSPGYIAKHQNLQTVTSFSQGT